LEKNKISTIQILSDAVANQIAAGEVVQRPASVVKELLENAVDAKANNIELFIEEGGIRKVLVKDDGCGMSAMDAKLCFERHATSKINNADDLFKLNTFGFRGEALASISAVARVTLKTRTENDQLGTEVKIDGSTWIHQNAIACPKGTQIEIKSLFFNLPARKHFLKTIHTETRYIVEEFNRVAICNPHLDFTLYNNNKMLLRYTKSSVEKRIAEVFEIEDTNQLLSVNEDTEIVKISGFIGTPKIAQRTRAKQYFIANGRFIKDNYLNHAIGNNFQGFIESKQYPSYCLYLDVDPNKIDINIHPTKTEVKFEEQRYIYQILQSAVKKTLGTHHQVPDIEGQNMLKNLGLKPVEDIDYVRNPNTEIPKINTSFFEKSNPNNQDWPALFKTDEIFDEKKVVELQKPLFSEKDVQIQINNCFQVNNTYLVASLNTEMYIVHQQRAHQRILFESHLNAHRLQNAVSQELLFPRTVELETTEALQMHELLPILNTMGFNIAEFGRNTFIINGIPPKISKGNEEKIVYQILHNYKQTQLSKDTTLDEQLAFSIAVSTCIPSTKSLSLEEQENLITQLFNCKYPTYTPNKRAIFHKFDAEFLSNFFN
tara:strand:+ start:1704 stop:3509 length:1806 start_codon:yes stop_codon:yes gene_type:complete